MTTISVLPDTDQRFLRIYEMEHALYKVMASYTRYEDVLIDQMILASWSGKRIQDLIQDLRTRVQHTVEPRSAAGWHTLVRTVPDHNVDLHTMIDTIQTMNDQDRYIQRVIINLKSGPRDIEKRVHTLTQLLSIWSSQKDVDINTLIESVHGTLEEVYRRDPVSHGMSGTGQRYAVVAMHDRGYMGHVFVRQDDMFPMVLGMIGIRSSIRNLIGRHCPNMAHILIKGAIDWAKQNGYEILKVQFPIGSMPSILSRMGFAKSVGDYWMRVQDFESSDRRDVSQIWYEDKRLMDIMCPPDTDYFCDDSD